MKAPPRDKERGGWERRALYIAGGLASLLLLVLLLLCVDELPDFGSMDSPPNNEVLARYLEDGLEETGALNLVTGLILEYRAFDTFGETMVLLLSMVAALTLLRRETSEAPKREPSSAILKGTATALLPLLLLYSVYIILNGHISPGGGFSGGVLLGSAGILADVAFSRNAVCRILTCRRVLHLALAGATAYLLCKLYVFFCGGNHLSARIPLGAPGSLFGAGLLPLLNLCVGLVVGCVIYGLYALFLRDDI